MKQLLKRIISERYISNLKRWRDLGTNKFIAFAARSRFLSVVYYIVFSRAFYREQQAVLFGRSKHLQDYWSASENQYMLRRNVHRLEKGLIMRPRRSVFALSYIDETVKAYVRACEDSSSASDFDEIKWAHDVLAMYFSKTDNTNTRVAFARDQFLSAPKLIDKNGTQFIPYKRNLESELQLRYEELLQLARQRRSVRWYLPTPVPRSLIDCAVSLASYSPSACNRQPFEFRIFDEPERVKRIASIPMGTTGFSHNFPVIVVVVGRQRAYRDERDRHIIYIDGALASMAFMFALETLGLSSCPINWPDIEHLEKTMSQELQLSPDERPIMLISLGYPDPDGMVAYSQKKMLDNIRRYN